MIYSIDTMKEFSDDEWKELIKSIPLRKQMKKMLEGDIAVGIQWFKLRDPVTMERSLYIVLMFFNSHYTKESGFGELPYQITKNYPKYEQMIKKTIWKDYYDSYPAIINGTAKQCEERIE